MLITGNDEVAIWRAAEIIYTDAENHGPAQTVTEIALELSKSIRELRDKPEGYFIGRGRYSLIRLLEHNPNDENSEANVYVGINVLEYQLNPKMYHYVRTRGKEYEYIDTPEIPEEDRF